MIFMSNPILQILRTYTEEVVDSMYLPLPEYATVEISGVNRYIRLQESNVRIPFSQCKFSEHLVRHFDTIRVEGTPMTGVSQDHQHNMVTPDTDILIRKENILKDRDEVIVIRMKKGRSYFVLTKVSSYE